VNSGAHACPKRGRGAPRNVHAQSWPRPNKGSGTSCAGVIKKMRLTDHGPTLTTSDDPFEAGEWWYADGSSMSGRGYRNIRGDTYRRAKYRIRKGDLPESCSLIFGENAEWRLLAYKERYE